MKGAVFIALNDLVESQYGIDVWEELLEEVKPVGDGIYTAVEDYPDSDIVNFVIAISKKLDLESSVVTRVFGEYLFGDLNKMHPIFAEQSNTLFEFLAGVEVVIHKEVRKLFDNPNLPDIDTEMKDSVLKMTYSSPRKLCYLAEGLIFGAAKHYGEEVSINHDVCMHKGDSHCILEIYKQDE